MAKIDIYKQRLEATGCTNRERNKNKLINDIKSKANTSLSCRNVTINDIVTDIFINSGSKPYYKEIQSLPNDRFYPGDMIYWNNLYWLVINADYDNEIYVDGNMTQCNYKLKWQNKNLDIISRNCIKTTSSNGIDEGNVISTGGNKCVIYISYDEETKRLKRGMRFFIDNNNVSPTVFKVSSIDNVSNVYNNHGYISITLEEDLFKVDCDNIDLFICNYKEKALPDIKDIYKSEIKCKSSIIKIGTKGTTFISCFTVNETIDENVNQEWEVIADFLDKITVLQKDNTITISTNDESLLDRNLRLVLKDTENKYPETSILLTIKEIF